MRTKTRSFPLILIQYMFSNKYTHAHIVQILTVRHFCLPHCVQYHVLTPRHRNIYTYIQSNHFKASLYINMSIFILSSPQGGWWEIYIYYHMDIYIYYHISTYSQKILSAMTETRVVLRKVRSDLTFE